MKRLFSALKRKTNAIVYLRTTKYPLILSTALLAMFLMNSCKKDVSLPANNEEIQTKSGSSSQKESNGIGNYTGLDLQTVWELQQAKIATAKYNNIENAIADGYFDAEIVVPEMGHHYLKLENLNATFEYDKPELLVYNKEENGRMKLVALEYAVPIALSPNPPAGYTGNNDSWVYTRGSCGHCMHGYGNTTLKVFLIQQIL